MQAYMAHCRYWVLEANDSPIRRSKCHHIGAPNIASACEKLCSMANLAQISVQLSTLLTAASWHVVHQGEVRRWAAALGLPNQGRRDSQGICFLGKVRFSEFVRQHLGTWPGAILEEETGEVMGFHEGFWFYTLGQRKGILLSGGPW